MSSFGSHEHAELLEFLSRTGLETGHYRAWAFARVQGGANNLVYHVAGAAAPCAVKFCIRDVRDRAGREYAALSLLERLGLGLAPKALLLDRERYPHPVVVQSWLEGEVMHPPATLNDWETLLYYYAALHRVTPEQGTLPHARHTASSIAEGKALIEEHVERLPETAYPTGFRALLEAFGAWSAPNWPRPQLSLCRVDPNPRNFVRAEGGLRSVDWENSGWGDPAFELADLLTHPAYLATSAETTSWVAERYAETVGDTRVLVRLRAYTGVGLMYWVVRFARMLYDVPRGLDARLVGRSETWEADTRRKYEVYRRRAEGFFSS